MFAVVRRARPGIVLAYQNDRDLAQVRAYYASIDDPVDMYAVTAMTPGIDAPLQEGAVLLDPSALPADIAAEIDALQARLDALRETTP